MITVISRPVGHKLTDAELTATVTNSSQEALFNTLFAHGLQTGDYVYVDSVIESYNGYKYVDSISYNGFKLKDSEGGDYVPFKQSVDIGYRISALTHGWLAVNNPIVYELESDLWPNNVAEEAYTPITIVSQANAEGYTQLNLSSGIADATELNFINLVGTGSLAGPYQIVTVLNPWSLVINLAYNAANSFTGYQVVNYYNNYCINVDIYCGLTVDHPWYEEKPYELAATLRFTPDSNGRCKFSISDIVKGYIETRNNLALDTLPNNLDFWTGFYIKHYESYDQSDGEEITTYTGFPLSDLASFEGFAVNADMPFKSLYVSHMSEYLNEDTYLAKWLVLQSNPVAIVGYFMDISFINHLNIDLKLIITKELDGIVLEEEITDLINIGIGVIRIPIEAESGFDKYCVRVYKEAVAPSTTIIPIDPMPDFLTWENVGTRAEWFVNGSLVELDTTSVPVNIGGFGPDVSDKWYTSYQFIEGKEYTLNYEVSTDMLLVLAPIFNIEIFAGEVEVDSSNPIVVQGGDPPTVGSFVFTAPAGADGISIRFTQAGTCEEDCSAYIHSLTLEADPTVIEDPGSLAGDVTETLCITILEECDSTFIADDDIRLTEDGEFRILE